MRAAAITESIESYQSWIYLMAILSGLCLGGAWPAAGASLEPLVWPLLGGLLYATFTQVPLARLRGAFSDQRFLAALLIGNFVLIPVFVSMLTLLPLSQGVLVGVLIVLLVPCTDWFITFTHLGRGDTSRSIAAAPILLIAQLVTLPLYLMVLLGGEVIEAAVGAHLLTAFSGLIVLPLLLAWWTEHLAQHRPDMRRVVDRLGALPVPLLALVVLTIAASQVTAVAGSAPVLLHILPIFIAFLVFAAVLGKLLGRLFGLGARSTRTLVFSFGTRNSFVVLPIALTLPEPMQAAIVVVVFQSLVELFGMIVYLQWVPRKLVPDVS